MKINGNFKAFGISLFFGLLVLTFLCYFTYKAQNVNTLAHNEMPHSKVVFDSIATQTKTSSLQTEFTYYDPGLPIPFSVRTPDSSVPYEVDVSVVAANFGAKYGAAWVDRDSGKALSFDGINDYVQINSSVTFDFTNAITVEAWITPNLVNNWSQASIISAFEGSKYKWKLGLNNIGNVRFDLYSGQADFISTIGGSVEACNWSHIVGTFDDAGICVYLNGIKVGENNWPYQLQNVNPNLSIGLESVNGRYFNGAIDEIRIYNRALNSDEIFYSYSKGTPFDTSGLQAWWRFDEGVGDYAYNNAPHVQEQNAFITLASVNGSSINGWFNNTISLPQHEGTFLLKAITSDEISYQTIKSSRLHCTIDTLFKLHEANTTVTLFGTVNYNDGTRTQNGTVYVNGLPVAFSDGFWSFDVTEPTVGKKVYQITGGNDNKGVSMLFAQPKLSVNYSYLTENSVIHPRTDTFFIIFEITLLLILFGSILFEWIYHST